MLIMKIRDYFAQHPQAALTDLARHLEVDSEILRGPLELLERTKQVRRLPAGTACKGCCQCNPHTVERYEWIAPIAIAPPNSLKQSH